MAKPAVSAQERRTRVSQEGSDFGGMAKQAAVSQAAAEETSDKSASKIKAELDDLLTEIDKVLETNAEQFVKEYIQKGGQ